MSADLLRRPARERAAKLRDEAIAHARAMVIRYELAVAAHPTAEPLTKRQVVEASNLQHWGRRLAAITTAAETVAHS